MQKKKKGAEGFFATSQIASSFTQTEPAKSAHNTRGEGGGGEIQQQQKLSTLCNNLTHKNALKPPRRHQQSLLICQDGTGSFSPPFSCNNEVARTATPHIVPLHALKAPANTPARSPPAGALCLHLGRTPHSLTPRGQSATTPFLCRELRCIRH